MKSKNILLEDIENIYHYVGSAWEYGGHPEVDRGQHHHAGDVDGLDQVVLCVSADVVGGLVDHVHEDGWEVGHHEDTEKFSRKNCGIIHNLAF